MAKIESKKMYALFVDEEQITDYIWEYAYVRGRYILLSNKYETKIYDKEISGFIFKQSGTVYDYDNNTGDFIIKAEDKYGVFNMDGRTFVPVKYKEIGWYESYIEVKDENNLWGAYDYHGKMIMPNKFDLVCDEDFMDDNETEILALKVIYVGVEGWYDIKNKKFYPVEDINITRTGIVEGLKDGIWSVLK